MLLFNIKLIFRRHLSRPHHLVILLLSLCIGFVASVLVVTWIFDELSYDRYHEKADRIYRLTVRMDDEERGFHWDFARSNIGWLMHMPDQIPGIEAMVRLGTWHEGIVLWSLVIAIPLAWYMAELWLDNYVYRFYQNVWMYLVASIILICSALLTVIWQSWNAAKMNPVDALKIE